VLGRGVLLLNVVRSFKLSSHSFNLLLIELYLVLALLKLSLFGPYALVLVAILETDCPSDASPRRHPVLLLLLLSVFIYELLQFRSKHFQFRLQLLILALKLSDYQLFFRKWHVVLITHRKYRID